jgi:hypothetical protein
MVKHSTHIPKIRGSNPAVQFCLIYRMKNIAMNEQIS